MPDTRKQSERPFHVLLKDSGALHSGHDTEDVAESIASSLNKRAEAMGIKTRYVVKPKG